MGLGSWFTCCCLYDLLGFSIAFLGKYNLDLFLLQIERDNSLHVAEATFTLADPITDCKWISRL